MEMYFSALTAILTVVGVLYGLWYNDIQNAIKSSREPHPGQYKAAIKNCKNSKVLPLLIISAVSVVAFLPVFIEIICSSFKYIIQGNAGYDPAKAIFLFLVALLLFLAVVMCIDLCKLCNKKQGET
jgi:hypothetical protein